MIGEARLPHGLKQSMNIPYMFSLRSTRPEMGDEPDASFLRYSGLFVQDAAPLPDRIRALKGVESAPKSRIEVGDQIGDILDSH